MTIKSISIMNTENGKVLEVLWKEELFDTEGNVVQEGNHRTTYSADQTEKFLAEVEGAEDYIKVLEWKEGIL